MPGKCALFVAACLVLGTAALWAQQQAQTYTPPDFPFAGEVTCERLNVRLRPNTDPENLIVDVLARGATVRVTGQEGSFFRIAGTERIGAWIWSGNGRVEGEFFVVERDQSPLRIDSRINAPQVATAPIGARLKIRRENMGWYQVAAPESAQFFVSARYIRPVQVTAATANEPEPARQRPATVTAEEAANTRFEAALTQAQEELDRQMAILDAADGLFRANFQRALELAQEALACARNPTARARAENLVRTIRAASVTAQITRRIVQQERQAQRPPPPPPPKTFLFRGRVEGVGLLTDRPSPYRLVDPTTGIVVCWLRLPEGNPTLLRACRANYRKFVGVNGQVEAEPLRGHPVLFLEEIEPLPEPETTP